MRTLASTKRCAVKKSKLESDVSIRFFDAAVHVKLDVDNKLQINLPWEDCHRDEA